MEMLHHLSSVKQLWAFLSASLPHSVCYGWETILGKPVGNRHSISQLNPLSRKNMISLAMTDHVYYYWQNKENKSNISSD